MEWHETGTTALLITRLVLAAWGVVTSLEWLANRSSFESGAILDQRVMSLRQNGALLRFVWSNFTLGQIASVRLAIATLLAISSTPTLVAFAAILLLVLSTLISAQAGYGGDGSDQMGSVALIGLILAAVGLASDDWGIWFAGILINGGQLTISYFVSGFSKWLSPIWRSGVALPGVMGTYTYGHDLGASAIVGRPWLAMLICWTIFTTETMFPLSLGFPPNIFYIVLAFFSFFHIVNAFFMGLNAFVWSFIATYPSVVILNYLVHDFLK
jgi:hypothetical protein